jgi:hypothetical protein
MGQDQGKFLSLRPAGPILRGSAGQLVDGPEIPIFIPQLSDPPATESQEDPGGNQGLDFVVEIKERQGLLEFGRVLKLMFGDEQFLFLKTEITDYTG